MGKLGTATLLMAGASAQKTVTVPNGSRLAVQVRCTLTTFGCIGPEMLLASTRLTGQARALTLRAWEVAGLWK
ncbi:MAG: hypothetical protein ACYS9C_00190 [Planctomycetota bacterium]